MYRVSRLAVVLSVTFFNSSSAYSEELDIDHAIQLALSQSTLVAEIDSNFAKEQRDASDLMLLPNPELDAEMQFYVRGAPDASSNQPSLALTQPFRLSHFGLRKKVSKLKKKAAKQGKEAELVVLLQRVKFAFARSWILSEKKSFATNVLLKTKEISSFVERGFQETIFGSAEREIFRAEVSRLQAELAGLDSEISRANSEFISITGVNTVDRKLKQPDLTELDSTLLKRFEQGNLKIQEKMKVLLAVSDQEKKLAERDAFPELRPRLVYAITNDGGEFYGLGVTIPLPFSNRNQNAILDASVRQQSAQKIANYYRSDTFKQQLTLLQNSIASSLRQLELYKTQVVPSFQKALSAYEQQLKSGKGTVLQVWQTAASLNDSYQRYSELWVKTFSEQTELNVLLQEEL